MSEFNGHIFCKVTRDIWLSIITYIVQETLSTFSSLRLGIIHKRRLPKGRGRGVQKMPQKETFTSIDLKRQGEGGYPKNLKFGETSFMDGPLGKDYYIEYRWTEHSILPMTTGGGLLTLTMLRKLTQSL